MVADGVLGGICRRMASGRGVLEVVVGGGGGRGSRRAMDESRV